jgi:hypothetical protein
MILLQLLSGMDYHRVYTLKFVSKIINNRVDYFRFSTMDEIVDLVILTEGGVAVKEQLQAEMTIQR